MGRSFPLSVCLFPLVASEATAQDRAFTVQGTITSAAPRLEAGSWDTVQTGDSFELTYRIDTETSTGFDEGTFATYTEPIQDVEIADGRLTASSCVDSFEIFVVESCFGDGGITSM